MPRSLHAYLLGCIALAFAFLLLHAREPLRLNLGDPEADAALLTWIEDVRQHGLADRLVVAPDDDAPPMEDDAPRIPLSPLARVVYGVIGGSLGIGDLGALRLIALACSALAALLLVQYARRIWSTSVAITAAALLATSLVWIEYADSLQHAPLVHASGFLALWGVVRAAQTRQRRHYAAIFFGAWLCFLAARDYWIFLPAATLFTVHKQVGHPLGRPGRGLVALCAAGCLIGALTQAWLGGDPSSGGAVTAAAERTLASPVPTLIRRYTLVFTPLFWITAAYTALRALRAPSPRAALRDGTTWMLAASVIFLWWFLEPESLQSFGTTPLLPVYAIGSALLIHHLLERGGVGRVLALTWAALAPAWAAFFLLTHARAVLARGSVAEVNTYLATHDRNDFVLSNLLLDGPLRAAFGRHNWALVGADREGGPVAPGVPAQLDAPLQRPTHGRPLLLTLQEPGKLDRRFAIDARVRMLEVLDAAGTDHLHAVIFTTPQSRSGDRVLWRLSQARRQWALTGWPQLFRSKTTRLIRDYDQLVLKNLEAVDAERVLHLRGLDVYRIDRAAVLEAVGREIPTARTLNLGDLESSKHKLLGWGEPRFTKDDGVASASIVGHSACPGPSACQTAQTVLGIRMVDGDWVDRAQLMLRVERACDLRLTVSLASPGLLRLSMNGATASQCAPERQPVFTIPRSAVRAGLNVVTLEKRIGPEALEASVTSITVDPLCAPE